LQSNLASTSQGFWSHESKYSIVTYLNITTTQVDLYGEASSWPEAKAKAIAAAAAALEPNSDIKPEGEEENVLTVHDREYYASNAVWRTSKWGHKKKNIDALEGRSKRLESREGIDDVDV
jgi:hypothetical protein